MRRASTRWTIGAIAVVVYARATWCTRGWGTAGRVSSWAARPEELNAIFFERSSRACGPRHGAGSLPGGSLANLAVAALAWLARGLCPAAGGGRATSPG